MNIRKSFQSVHTFICITSGFIKHYSVSSSFALVHHFQKFCSSSFPDCYASEFSDLEMVQEGQGGVPLEHLITCVPGVNIATAQNGIKVVKWIHNKPPPPTAGTRFTPFQLFQWLVVCDLY